MSKSQLPLLALAFLWLWEAVGCGPQEEVVARVGERAITAGELRQFKAETPELFRSEKQGIEATREYLQTLIDMELMLREARGQALDRDAEFLRRWEEERRKKLVARYQQLKIWEDIQFSEEELQRRFAQSKWSRVLKLAQLRVRTEEDAGQVALQLEGGRPFAEVAGEWSADPDLARRGGLLDIPYGRLNMRELGVSPAIGEELFDLEKGAHTRAFRLGDHWVIFQLVERLPAPPHYAEIFARETIKEEFYQRRKDLVAALEIEFGVELDAQTISLLVARAAAGPIPQLAQGEEGRILCRFRDGQLTAGDFAAAYQQLWFFNPGPLDSSGVVRVVRQHLLPDVLLFRLALREGLEQDPAVVSWLKIKEEELLLERLRQQQVERRIEATPEAVRRYYETHSQLFVQPEELQVVEILVATREEAEALLRRLGAGEDSAALARRYSLRHGAQHNGGYLRLRPYQRAAFGSLLDAVGEAKPGELRGPVQVEGGYSVVEVKERLPPRLQPFEQVLPRVLYWFKNQEEERLFAALLHRLREKYAAEVVLFEEQLHTAQL